MIGGRVLNAFKAVMEGARLAGIQLVIRIF